MARNKRRELGKSKTAALGGKDSGIQRILKGGES